MSDIFPEAQPLTTAQQQRIRAVLNEEIESTPSRSRRPRRRWAVAAGGIAAATAGAISWAAFSPSPASAWAPFPQPVTGSAATRLQSDCKTQVSGHAWPIPTGGLDNSLAEQRGASSAVLLFGSDGRQAICVDPHGSGQAFTGPLVGVSTTDDSHAAVTAVTDGGPGLGMWAVHGRVPSRAAKVLVILGDGQQVTASVGHGHYLAWWPSTDGSGSVRVTDASGAVVATRPLHLSGAAPVPRRSPS